MKTKTITRIIPALFLFSSGIFAMQINPTLAPDILRMKNAGVSISYNIFDSSAQSDNSISLSVQNLPVAHFKDFFNAFNSEHGSVVPGNSLSGKPSVITFGYVENGNSIYPASCQLITLKSFVANILISKNGCTIN